MSVKTQERVNGTLEGVRTAIRLATIELSGDYEGWHATMRVNPPVRVWEDFASGEDERFSNALMSLVSEWNFVDDEGQPLPLPKDGLDWNQAPFDLKLRLTNAYSAVVQARMSVPKEPSTNLEPTSPNGT